ncbi:class I adenylate-forming enzyme family protein [Lachnotalea glycerini]|uniref:Long-chain fatty acid--CoA ligase n=1 Tax=Lachnotalea glycerini TaxID=1763509 RepID=A0A371J969_9FIRM|nr:class I adenylate-forming enzyme family protein [Lachnotalea glycerini]RDY29285.1 long-chain fatty acid--CoA ligase [Lachnotalea glycerini]
MIQGIDYWDNMIQKNLKEQDYNHVKVMGYDKIPDSLYCILRNTAKKFGNKIVFWDEWERSYSYRQFLLEVDCLAFYLQTEKKVKRGDHVGILLHNSIEFCCAFYAIQKLGAVAITLPSKFRRPEIEALIHKSDLNLLIYSETFAEWIKGYHLKNISFLSTKEEEKGYGFRHLNLCKPGDIEEERNLADPAVIMFTSGTTSESKGVVLRNYNLVNAIIVYQRILGIRSEDKTIIPVPIYHITGLIALLGLFVYAGAEIYLCRRYEANKILECVKKHEITFMHGSPTVYYKLLEIKDNYPILPSLRMLACGSSYMPVEKMKKIHQWLPNTKFQIVYGMTETSSPALIFPNDAPTSIYAGAAGKPIPGIEFKFLDDKGTELTQNQIGEIWIRGNVVTQGYYKIKTDLISQNGWLNTGDMGYYNEDGYVYIVDRKKDMINRGGEKIWCSDVEEELHRIRGVKEATVVGIEDSMYGEIPVALIVREKNINITSEEITLNLKERIARYKIPTQILFAEEIPKTPGLKIDKKQIKEMFVKEESDD